MVGLIGSCVIHFQGLAVSDLVYFFNKMIMVEIRPLGEHWFQLFYNII